MFTYLYLSIYIYIYIYIYIPGKHSTPAIPWIPGAPLRWARITAYPPFPQPQKHMMAPPTPKQGRHPQRVRCVRAAVSVRVC